ncbi:MAG: helix-turn-helix domain-containing protein [Gallionellaceae bacterium]|nr:helix-turn-helix domain-containing protein [Gallionellaceae bacterium]
MTTFGDRIRMTRLAVGISQKELAKKAGVSQGLIGQLESGRNQGSKYIVTIAKALNCPIEWLATGKGQMRGTPSTEILQAIANKPELMQLLRIAEPLAEYQLQAMIQMGQAFSEPEKPKRNGAKQK